MAQHGLKQTDLSEEIGGQSVVSEIRTGKRESNARQSAVANRRFSRFLFPWNFTAKICQSRS